MMIMYSDQCFTWHNKNIVGSISTNMSALLFPATEILKQCFVYIITMSYFSEKNATSCANESKNYIQVC